MQIVRLPMQPSEVAAVDYCDERGLRLLSLEQGPDGSWRGIAVKAPRKDGRGRPPRKIDGVRSLSVHVRLTATEYEHVSARARREGTTISALLRASCR